MCRAPGRACEIAVAIAVSALQTPQVQIYAQVDHSVSRRLRSCYLSRVSNRARHPGHAFADHSHNRSEMDDPCSHISDEADSSTQRDTKPQNSHQNEIHAEISGEARMTLPIFLLRSSSIRGPGPVSRAVRRLGCRNPNSSGRRRGARFHIWCSTLVCPPAPTYASCRRNVRVLFWTKQTMTTGPLVANRRKRGRQAPRAI